MKKIIKLTVLAAAFASQSAWAQTAPDAGRILREVTPAPTAPRESPALQIQTPAATAVAPGGRKVEVKSVQIVGATVIPEVTLREALGDVVGQSYDMAGLRALALKISNRYREAGYPFARAFIPPQDMASGALRIEVLEGRFGKVQAIAEGEKLQADAQRFLAPLVAGDVIEGRLLERVTLLIDDLPGVAVTPLIRPGQSVGTGDLDARVTRTAPVDGEFGFDNHGNYYSGEARVRAAANFNSPFMLGDRLSVSSLYSNENLRLLGVNYALPLGVSGLRGNVGYAHTAYDLGRGFEGNKGTAKVSTLGVSYLITRSQKSNLNFSATLQNKRLFNSRSYGADEELYSVGTMPVALQFDHRDGLGGGGITYGVLSWTPGRLRQKTETSANFSKLNADVIRLQSLPGSWSIYTRVSAQATRRNLDSAEGFSLGGPTGVRAYPTGEASGDEGWIAQIELRYAVGATAPYMFYDQGQVKVDARPELVASPSADKERAGFGVGVRHVQGPWNIDAALAWRTKGGAPEAVTARDPKPRAWVNVAYRF
jgi:hemolysin activation/secretion protein